MVYKDHFKNGYEWDPVSGYFYSRLANPTPHPPRLNNGSRVCPAASAWWFFARDKTLTQRPRLLNPNKPASMANLRIPNPNWIHNFPINSKQIATLRSRINPRGYTITSIADNPAVIPLDPGYRYDPETGDVYPPSRAGTPLTRPSQAAPERAYRLAIAKALGTAPPYRRLPRRHPDAWLAVNLYWPALTPTHLPLPGYYETPRRIKSIDPRVGGLVLLQDADSYVLSHVY